LRLAEFFFVRAADDALAALLAFEFDDARAISLKNEGRAFRRALSEIIFLTLYFQNIKP